MRSERHRARKRHHAQTSFIELDSRRCQACWACLEACPKNVLGKIDFFFHRHVKIKHAELCIGCMACVRACPHGALCAKPKEERHVER